MRNSETVLDAAATLIVLINACSQREDVQLVREITRLIFPQEDSRHH